MPQYILQINNTRRSVEAEPGMPLLWVLRDLLNLTGTKYGCGMGLCGACTVHVDGEATRSCQVSVAVAAGKQLTTIEGLGQNGLHIVQDNMGSHTGPGGVAGPMEPRSSCGRVL